MNRIQMAFQKGKAFMPFITCGDPDLFTTERIVKEAVKNGADCVILGIPFSDPTAEGTVIMEASQRALTGGVTTDTIFELVRKLRKEVEVPLVFMTYANVIFSYGTEKFIAGCKETGIDGIMLHDLPYEEKEDFAPLCRQYNVALISMLALTSKQRTAMIAKEAEGFLYLTVGNGRELQEVYADIDETVSVVRKNTDIPCVVSLDEATPKQVKEMAAVSDGVMVSTSIVKKTEEYGKEAAEYVGALVKEMQQAVKSE